MLGFSGVKEGKNNKKLIIPNENGTKFHTLDTFLRYNQVEFIIGGQSYRRIKQRKLIASSSEKKSQNHQVGTGEENASSDGIGDEEDKNKKQKKNKDIDGDKSSSSGMDSPNEENRRFSSLEEVSEDSQDSEKSSTEESIQTRRKGQRKKKENNNWVKKMPHPRNQIITVNPSSRGRGGRGRGGIRIIQAANNSNRNSSSGGGGNSRTNSGSNSRSNSGSTRGRAGPSASSGRAPIASISPRILSLNSTPASVSQQNGGVDVQGLFFATNIRFDSGSDFLAFVDKLSMKKSE